MRHIVTLLLLFAFSIMSSCRQDQKMFTEIGSDHSGINFSNDIIENDSINPLDVINIYNGGGVGVGDFNNDGLQDLYFTGNVVPSKLYLNKGDLEFTDITDEAGVGGQGRWCRAVSIVDINNDGLQDIYVSATLQSSGDLRRNLLYVNQGVDQKNTPHFKDMAMEYGLADTGHSTHTVFFDYDNDGDLDAYILTNEVNTHVYPDIFHEVLKAGENPSTGRLYQNNWNESLKHPVYTDVSKQAGIQTEGYGHSVNITDINNDGWKDIYVTNDFITNDLLWINNHDGTFSEQLSTYFKHTSANAMGTDIVDINNDGLPDVIALDMNPQDNYRKKMMMNSNSYQRYQNSDRFGFNYQYVRNTLQLNLGPRPGKGDSVGAPIFADVAYYSGIAETDWSWTPVIADLDNDGNRDMIVTNGFPKDVTDHDFISYRNQATNIASKDLILGQIPEVRIHNYAFRNNGDLTFSNVTSNWGFDEPTFSNGAVYVDLDNDGDQEVVINNIKSKASLYRNNSRERSPDSSHYIRISFKGDSLNKNGLGAYASVYYDGGKMQVWENTPYRGYLSSVDPRLHFGLGKAKTIDSVVIIWPNGRKQSISQIRTDTVLTADITHAKEQHSFGYKSFAANSLFKDITDSIGIHFKHREKDFVDFNIQKLLPHKLSEFGPALASGDIDNNGLDDIIIGGAIGHSATMFLQQANGKFLQKTLLKDTSYDSKKSQDLGLLLFDADKDGDLDLYIASGGYIYKREDKNYQDRFYINNGKGSFTIDTIAIPLNHTSKACVRAADYDKDGDLDLFVSGRVDPWFYPRPVTSFIYRNDGKNGKAQFTDVTATIAKDLVNAGMICDAVFSDFDNDGWTDLVVAGEWLPVTFLKNNNGVFKNVNAGSGIDKQIGWWNTIAPGDFDNDGDIDYVVGNAGENTFYKASENRPVSIYAKDFDNNGSYDAIPSVYIPSTMTDTTSREFPAFGRDDLIKQMISMRSKFQSYNAYALATMDSMFTKEQLKDAVIYRANQLKSCFVRNDGSGKFSISPLPIQAQLSMLCGIVTDDINGDGNLDLTINGNDYSTEVGTGRYDALNGLVMLGDGKGGFRATTLLDGGLFIPGNGKALVKFRGVKGDMIFAASENRGPLRMFSLKQNMTRNITILPGDAYVEVQYKNGKKQKQECYYGNSYMSQSARFISVGPDVQSVTITDQQGNKRQSGVDTTKK